MMNCNHSGFSDHSYEQNMRHILPKEETKCVVLIKLVSGCAKQVAHKNQVNHSFVFDPENNIHCKQLLLNLTLAAVKVKSL